MTIPNQKHADFYRSLILNSGDAMYLSNLDGKLIEVNKQACANLGYTREELLSLSISDINPEYKTEEQVNKFFRILEREKYCKLTTHHKRKDGSIFPVEISISLLNENGSKIILGISRDITEHVEAKQNLFSYIDTLEKMHRISLNSTNIEKYISDVLKLVQDVFKTDRTFLLAAPGTKDSYQFPPVEVVKSGVSCISILDKSEISYKYQQELFEKRKYPDNEVFLSTYLESEKSESFIKELHIKSEMIAAITNINNTDFLLGVHQCSEIWEWTKLEEKLFIEISRRLGDTINRLLTYHNLKQSEKKYKALYDNAPLPYHSLNADGNIIDVNNTWLSLLGYKKKDVLGKNYGDFLHPDWQHVFDTNFPKFKISGYVNDVHFKIRHKKGHYMYISLAGCTGCHPDGSFKQTYCVFQDITARKKAEDKLKESESRFKTFVQQVPIPLCHVNNSTGDIKYVNDRFLNIFGYTLTDIPNLNSWWKLACPDPEYREWAIDNWEKAVDYGIKYETDIIPDIYDIRCKNGTVKQVLISGIILGDDFLANFIDLTAQKEIECELITAKEKAEENEKLKTAFLANMSHEIRTPMNGILGFADLLQTPKLSSEKREKYIKIILQSGERMLSTINAIIEISKIETKQIVPYITEIDLTQLIQGQRAFFTPEANKKDITLYCKPLTDKKILLSTDCTLLNSIFTNLINNAIKYTDYGSIEFGYTQSESSLEFFVKDTGIGIPQNVQHNIFDRFTRVDQDNTKAIEGSGLGLSITKAYVELLGGKIWMESEEGIGSQFFFTLPIKS